MIIMTGIDSQGSHEMETGGRKGVSEEKEF